MTDRIIYALDFDGVLCDSAIETAMTGWKAATQVWSDMVDQLPPQTLINAFRQVRPALETGYEAILIMRLLQQGISADTLLAEYAEKIASIIQQQDLDIAKLKFLFGETRDQWIADDLPEWIAMNPLFPGIAEKLRRLNNNSEWVIITTKQERFVKQILHAQQIDLADEHIFGLDRNMSKPAVLTQMLEAHPQQTIRFIEDRLPTLDNVLQHPQLDEIQLFLAKWGYNTEQDRQAASQSSIRLLDSYQFLAKSNC